MQVRRGPPIQPHFEVKGCCDPALLFRRVFKTARLNSSFARGGIGPPKGVRLVAELGAFRDQLVLLIQFRRGR
jgi:hypothetical protein